jgi:cyanophycinase-like exopeptidase
MFTAKGKIVLMGSGEMTSTMVEVHKGLLSGLPVKPKAVFLDTPAGFQMNATQLYQKASEYFRDHIQNPISLATFKSKDDSTAFEAEEAFHVLRESRYIFIGPGSPTYALHHWKETPIPDIMFQCVQKGGCLVAASAAALTLGRFTLPVYEIYKVGQNLFWAEGLDILGRFGFNLIIIPHWNNTEGGNHDTRFCYMGEPRFRKLEALLPESVPVIGLDEHTACILDLQKGEAEIKGIGSVTLRTVDKEISFSTGERFPIDILPKKEKATISKSSDKEELVAYEGNDDKKGTLEDITHSLEKQFHRGIEKHDFNESVEALLELDQKIWQARSILEDESSITRGRAILRSLIYSLGAEMGSSPGDRDECLAPLIEAMLNLRQNFRENKQWAEADRIRDILSQVNVVVEDTPSGSQWKFDGQEGDSFKLS